MALNPRRRFQLETSLFFVSSILFVLLAVYGNWFGPVDRRIYDALVSLVPVPNAGEVIIVGIDEKSLAALGPWPWPRSRQAQLMRVIATGQPAAVLIDVVHAGETNAAADAELVAAAATTAILALPLMIDALANRGQLIEVMPYPDLLATADVLGHVHVQLDEDAIVRGTYLRQGIGTAHWSHIALALADQLGRADADRYRCETPQPAFSIQNHRCAFVYTPFVGPPGSFPEISALDLIRGDVVPAVLAGRVVFVGVTASGTTDLVTTPVSGESRPMSGIEFNANLYNALALDRVRFDAPASWIYMINLFCVALPVLVLPRLKAKGMLASASLCAALPVALMAGFFVLGNRWLPLSAAAVGCLLAYPYWSWRRHEVAWTFVEDEIQRIERERQRWDLSNGVDAARQIDRLAALLDARIVHAADSTTAAAVIEFGDMRLARNEAFSDAERRLAEQTFVALARDDGDEGGLPGEALIAEIRRLKLQAETVHAGRETAQRGLEQMPNGVVVFSNLGEVLFINSAARAFLAVDCSSLADYLELLRSTTPPLGQNWRELARSIVLEQRLVSFETTTVAGQQVLVEGAPLSESGPVESWVVTITDMTDIRRAERDREEALAFLSHDLRSPMLSVLALVRGGPKDALLGDIGNYAQRALQASDRFLQLSRVQAREEFEVYDVDVLAVVGNALEQMHVLAAEKRIRFDSIALDEASEEGVWITGNGELLERAFENLLSNAVKYSPAGSRVAIEIEEQPDRILVAVVDQGVGIPEAELDRIFEPFFRSRAEALVRERGAGLGLRFVKTVLERHGGSIRVASEVGVGSRFTVTLPKS